ncbi:rhodanese-like domain-containing protein [Paramagnetospirillum kuznetsovii]|uniref:Rhodanese-like domain-containing protein n=1 Tax=Paramagnetospirillum kuznetsovii TaxID=2053833 RepID=A0A364NZF3_9PROT|nr:rhodanese-like domain-containing protein [Paramagnetospirillum kuznetsovii]RAU22461.1 rhodanese-like domain-containing protein [Paramagnetospirillum kuznetsovii]
MLSRLFNAFGAPSAPGGGKVQVVDPVTIRRWWEAGEVVLIDVRERDENAAERIEGALNLPLSSFNPAEVPVPPEGKRLVIHCRSGVRCGSATNLLLAAGWDGEITRMEGGLMGWTAFGGPTKRGS